MKYILINSLPSIERIQNFVRKKINFIPEEPIFNIITPKEGKYTSEEIREFFEQITRSRLQSENTIHIIMQCELITPVTQNIMLKPLEESNCVIILSVNNPASILPTIRSRCNEIYVEKTLGKNQSSRIKEIKLDLPKLSKMDRETLIAELVFLVDNSNADYKVILAFEESIKMLKANCKIESVLAELYRKVQN